MVAFAGHSIIITGASEGIGRALARALAPQRPGSRSRHATVRAWILASECRDLGAEVRVQPTDVTDSAACRALVEDTAMEFGAIDVLVNNAGGTMWTRFDRVEDPSIFETLMRLNYLGSVYPTLHALPHLKRSRGRIVAVSSMAGLIGVPERTAYAASKHAVTGSFDSLRIELRERCLGHARPPRLRRLGNPSPRARARRSAAGRQSNGGIADHDRGALRRADGGRDRAARPGLDHLGAGTPRALAPPVRTRGHRSDGGERDPRPTVAGFSRRPLAGLASSHCGGGGEQHRRPISASRPA